MDISFYHLTSSPLEKALPALMEKLVQSGKHAVLMAENEPLLKQIDQFLWTFSTNRFVPHGTKEDGYEEKQPIYLTLEEKNPNKAELLVTIGTCDPAFAGDFSRRLVVFNGNDEAELQTMRTKWKELKADNENQLTYWKQDEKGKWEQAG